MSDFELYLATLSAKQLVYLFGEASAKIIEHSNDARDVIFANLLEKDPLASELWNYLNNERLTKPNSALYHIRKALLLLDILSDHQILETCKDISPRAIDIFCHFIRIDFLSGVLGVADDFNVMEAAYVEYYLKEDLICFKTFINTR